VKDEAGAETQRNADNKLMTEASAFCALGIQPERAGRMWQRSQRTRKTITASPSCWFGQIVWCWI